ncbi:hypothetical protein DMN91_009423 [Ooceraea biroi]|uniref:Uncharacterized protein n=1 Tax=Ooceraea biroi TaxID=2015173 RepID=A0A3L8DF37_OOCBI|nr:hypothetical protein DMN91_009423 [Ooceraea biroi]
MKGLENLNRYVLEARIQNLEADWTRFQSNHDKLIGSITEDTRKLDYFTDDLYAGCENAYFEVKSSLMQLCDTFPDPEEKTSTSNSANPEPGRALPKISLPKFTGSYQE